MTNTIETAARLDIFRDLSEYKLSNLEDRGVPEDAMRIQRQYFKSLLEVYEDISILVIQSGDISKPIMTEPFYMQLNMTEEGYREGFYYRDYFVKMLETKETAYSDVYVSKATLENLLRVVVPVKDDEGNILTMLGAGVSLANMTERLNQVSFQDTGITYLVTDLGTVVGHPEIQGEPEENNILDTDFYKSISSISDHSQLIALQGPIYWRKGTSIDSCC